MNVLPKDWIVSENRLYRQFVFKNFVDAFGFMSKVAILSEKNNHHPDWSNSYKTVDIYLTSHDQGSIITQKDLDLAQKISEIYVI